MTTKSNPKSNVRKAPQSDSHNQSDSHDRKGAGDAMGHQGENDASQAEGHGHKGADTRVAAKTDMLVRRGPHGEAKEGLHHRGHHELRSAHGHHGRHETHPGQG